MYIFLDESGDLGFDFTKNGTSKFFVISLLIIKNQSSIKAINIAIGKIIKKINSKRKKKFTQELKGINVPLNLKKIFYNKIANTDWYIYSVVVDKTKFRKPKYIKKTADLYNYVAARLFNKIVVENPRTIIIVSIDKSKSVKEIIEFNKCLEEIFYTKLSSVNNLEINHFFSHENRLLQAIDLFCSGIFTKHTQEDASWYEYFCNKILIEIKL